MEDGSISTMLIPGIFEGFDTVVPAAHSGINLSVHQTFGKTEI